MEPPINRKWKWRAVLIGSGYLAAALLLAWRAVDLQIMDQQFLQDQGDARHLRTEIIPAHRGMITARNGEPLAVSTPVDSIWVNPKELGDNPTDLELLAAMTGINADELKQTVATRQDRDFVYVRRHMSPDDAARIVAAEIPGVHL